MDGFKRARWFYYYYFSHGAQIFYDVANTLKWTHTFWPVSSRSVALNSRETANNFESGSICCFVSSMAGSSNISCICQRVRCIKCRMRRMKSNEVGRVKKKRNSRRTHTHALSNIHDVVCWMRFLLAVYENWVGLSKYSNFILHYTDTHTHVRARSQAHAFKNMHMRRLFRSI